MSLLTAAHFRFGNYYFEIIIYILIMMMSKLNNYPRMFHLTRSCLWQHVYRIVGVKTVSRDRCDSLDNGRCASISIVYKLTKLDLFLNSMKLDTPSSMYFKHCTQYHLKPNFDQGIHQCNQYIAKKYTCYNSVGGILKCWWMKPLKLKFCFAA